MIYIVLLFVLFLVGIPICFSLGLVSIFGMVQGATPMIVVIQRLFTGADSTALIAIPLFILAGGLMVQGGISNRIVSFADALIGHFPVSYTHLDVYKRQILPPRLGFWE